MTEVRPMVDIAQAREALGAERTKILHQLEELGATPTGELSGDMVMPDNFADAAAATSERTELLGLAEALAGQLSEVEGALVRIDEGTYGVCSVCGKPIGAARLEFRPQSTQCVNCKSANSG